MHQHLIRLNSLMTISDKHTTLRYKWRLFLDLDQHLTIDPMVGPAQFQFSYHLLYQNKESPPIFIYLFLTDFLPKK